MHVTMGKWVVAEIKPKILEMRKWNTHGWRKGGMRAVEAEGKEGVVWRSTEVRGKSKGKEERGGKIQMKEELRRI